MSDNRNSMDIHAGHQLRIRRLLVGISQEKLAETVGLTFQQIQKYEKGANRMGASRLHQFAAVLGVPAAYFFEGAPSPKLVVTGVVSAEQSTAADLSVVVESLSSAEGVVLNRDFARIVDPKVRRHIVNLVSALAGSVVQSIQPTQEAA